MEHPASYGEFPEEREVDPALAEAFERLGVANTQLYYGPIAQIHLPHSSGIKSLTARGLMRRLRATGGIRNEQGASIEYSTRPNVEGSYYYFEPDETVAALHYRIHRGHYAETSDTTFRFSNGNPGGEFPHGATPEQMRELAGQMDAMRTMLDAALEEMKTRIERASSTLTEEQKEMVAAALIQLGGKAEDIMHGLRKGLWSFQTKDGLKIERERLEKLDALLDQVAQLDRLGVHLNPKVIKAKVSYIDNVMEAVEQQTFNRDLETFLENISQGSHGTITNLVRGWFAGVLKGKTREQRQAERQEEGQALFTRTQQEILGKLNLLKVRLSALGGDASLGANPGSDEFVSTCLEFLDYEVTPVI